MTKLALVLSTLVIFALVFATMSALATRPTKWEFEAVIHEGPGPSAETCRYYWEDPGVEMRARHCVVTTVITGDIAGEIEITLDLYFASVGPDVKNYMRLRATITVDDGEFYKMVADLTIQNGDISGPFMINGRGGHIKGTLTAELGTGADLVGTGILH